MQLTLVHNPNAGEGSASRAELVGALEAAGHEVRYMPHDESSEPGAFEAPGDVVIVAGGDGTVADVAVQLAGREVSLAILPTGTSNNVARSLGISSELRALLDMLGAGPRPAIPAIPWSVGVARAPWGEKRFVEAAGVGLFARFLRELKNLPADEPHMDPSLAEARHDEIRRGRRLLLEVLNQAPANRLTITADGEELTGEYIFAEVLNVRFAGPGIELASVDAAERAHHRLVLATLDGDSRRSFAEFLSATIRGAETHSPAQVRAIRNVTLEWPIAGGRLDDRRWPKSRDRQAAGEARGTKPMVEITTVDGYVNLLVQGSGPG